MENFGKFMAIILLMIISPIIRGFVTIKLWAWFIVPTFEINPLRLVEAIGIMFLINYIRAKRSKDSENFWKDFFAKITFLIILSGFALFFGWIVQMFM